MVKEFSHNMWEHGAHEALEDSSWKENQSSTINLLSEWKPFVDLNDLLEYSANTNVIIEGKGTMLTYTSDLKQFGQGVNEKPT
jgi:hypothetical protein